MSLINKMLRDLESRDRAASKPAARLTFEDLRAVRSRRKGSSLLRPTLVLVSLTLVAIAAAAYYALRTPVRDQVMPAKIPTPVVAPVTTAAVADVAVQKDTASETPAPAAEMPSPEKVLVPRSAPPPPTTNVPRTIDKPPVATTQRAQNPPAPAVDTDKTIIEKHDRPATAQERAEAHYRQAAQQVSQGRNDQARAALATALSIFPEHHKARELAAAVALQGGHVREAQELLQQGMEVAPQQSTFPRLLARIQLEQGLEAQAIATLEGARSAGHRDADFLSLLAALYQRAGRHGDATKTYRETITLRPQDARAWLGLGISLEASQDPSAAEAYTRTLQLGGLDASLVRYASQRLAALKK